jgi:hypothetical protein
MQRDQEEIVARGPSTRAVPLRGEDYLVSFTKEALAGMVEQVQSGYVIMNIDHLSYLPPVGHWHRAEVVTDDEGHSELMMYGHLLLNRRATDNVLSEGPKEGAEGPDSISGAQILLESRNFEPEVWQSINEESPLPVHEQAAWSSLPPLVWVIIIPVAWGVVQFSGSFLKRLGEAAADGLVKWIQTQAPRARDSSRESLIEVRFEIASNLCVSGFIPFNAKTQGAIDELRQGLEGLGPLATST